MVELTPSVMRQVRRVARRAKRLATGPVTPQLPTAQRADPLCLVNLAANPGFRATGTTVELVVDGEPVTVRRFDQPLDRGGVYVHVHNTGHAAEVPGLPGVTGVLVTGTDDDNDTHVAPGGRNAAGRFRLGMSAGATYTVSVSAFLPAPLTGRLHRDALRVVVGCLEGPAVRWKVAASAPARNEYGDHRVSVTFTLPAEATGAFLRLISGMSQGHGSVYWHSLTVTETDRPVPYFDGSSTGDPFHEYRWLGEPDASGSVRRLRAPQTVAADRAVLAEQAGRLAADGFRAEARALRSHLESSPDRYAELAKARMHRAGGRLRKARRVLEVLLQQDDPDGAAAFELGLVAEQERAWTEAERWFRQAVQHDPRAVERSYRLAHVLDMQRRGDDSRQVTAEALGLDHGLPFDGSVALEMDARVFGVRRDVGLFLAEHLPQLRHQVRDRMAGRRGPDGSRRTGLRRPVFVYWAQGFDAAPPVVQRCRAALHASNPDADVHELTDLNLHYYVDLPDDLVEATANNKTHFSDLLRLAVLERYGGVWLDATCLVTEPLGPRVGELLEPAGLFAFSYTGARISSWFLACRPESYPVHLWRAAMWLWWEKHGELTDYFLLHHMFELLHHLDEEFRAEWDRGARRDSGPPHALQQEMLDPFDPARFDRLVAGSFVHKLRYKYQPHEVSPDSYLAHLVRRDPGYRADQPGR